MAKETTMPKVIYEREKGTPLPVGYIDGMQSVIDEYDFQPTEFIVGVEDPPLGFWLGTHTRDGKRVRGTHTVITEEMYKRGEQNGTVQRDAHGNPIYA